MKAKTIKLFGIIMMLVMGMSFTACPIDDENDNGGDGSGQKGDIVGNWYSTSNDYQRQILFTFYSGGTYIHFESEPSRFFTDPGRWRYEGDLIILMTEDGNDYKASYNIKWLGDDEIKLTDEYGNSAVYERVDFSELPPLEENGDNYIPQDSIGNDDNHLPQDSIGNDDIYIPQDSIGNDNNYFPQDSI